MKHVVLLGSLALAIVLGAAFAPVYQFYAHRGVLPLPPWGWASVTETAPETQRLFDQSYAAAGDRALRAMVDYRAANNLPSLSAAVAVSGAVVWAGSVGFSDLLDGKPATPSTLYRIGSTSKALTATALARLVQRGVIDLDQPVASYSASAQNPSWTDITARQLASHSAGMPHYGENGDLAGLYRSVELQKRYADVRDSVPLFDGSPLLFQPGTDFHYSSLGTVLLGAAMSDAAGLSYRELMTQSVFLPAGMSNTFAAGDQDDRAADLATFYYSDGQRFRPWRAVNLSHRLPGGGYVSSPIDLVKLGRLYFSGEFLDDRTRAEFWTPQRLSDGSINEQNYALGWRWREIDFEGIGAVKSATHGGVSRGSQCWLLLYPESVMSMAFCTNTKTEDFGTFGRFYRPFYRAFADA